MVPKQILASFPCRIRRRARLLSAASIGCSAKSRARSRPHVVASSSEPYCASRPSASFASALRA